MVLHFNVTGESRKAMVKAIETELQIKAKYLGVPSCAYQIGEYRVERDGTLTYGDMIDADPTQLEVSSRIIDACVKATGASPEEWENIPEEEEKDETEPAQGGGMGLTVTIPLEKVNIGNLTSLMEAKGNLIKRALGIEDVRFTTDGENISFPWFGETEPEEAHTYTKFISAVCEMTVKQKRITAKPKENENEKYAFRCFLLRLGFIGDEFKADRKLLLSKLDGSSAFKNGQKGGGQ